MRRELWREHRAIVNHGPFQAWALLGLTCLALSGCGPDTMTDHESALATVGGQGITNVENSSANLTEYSDRVLVIENADSPVSMQIVKYYMEKRRLKKKFQVHCPDSSLETAKETLDFAAFQSLIEKPLKAYLASDSSIDFIVLTKGIPIRLTGAPIGLSLTQPSLDSYLSAIDYFDRPDSVKVEINDSGFTGRCFVNRFWNSTTRFSHSKFGGYLVTRLDGYNIDAAMGLVDSSLAGDGTKPQGKIFLDARMSVEPNLLLTVPFSPIKEGVADMQKINEMGFAEWDADMIVAGTNLEKSGVPVELDQTDVFHGNRVGLMGYCSWGSNDGKFNPENYKSIRFAPGGIAETAVSTSGRTFLPTSGGQSLIADLIDAKVTGVKGYCDEPFLVAIASPSILFDRYSQGWTLAESFYAASRFVGWEDIVIGDPLASPYTAK